MAGTLTLGGMSDGVLVGEIVIGPNSINGNRAIGDVLEITLEANVDYTVKVPSEAQAFAVIFSYGKGGTAGEVKVGSNLVATANGFPIPSESWFGGRLWSGITELKFKAASPPAAFNLVFV